MKPFGPILVVLLAVLLLSGVACGGGEPSGHGATLTITTGGGTTDGGETDTQPHEKFGEITELGHRTLLIDDQEIEQLVALFAREQARHRRGRVR